MQIDVKQTNTSKVSLEQLAQTIHNADDKFKTALLFRLLSMSLHDSSSFGYPNTESLDKLLTQLFEKLSNDYHASEFRYLLEVSDLLQLKVLTAKSKVEQRPEYHEPSLEASRQRHEKTLKRV